MTAPDPSCLFCKFVAREITPDIVAETAHSLAFRDLNPQAPTHVLIVPKRHVPNAAALAAASPVESADVLALGGIVAQDEGLGEGYRFVFNTGPQAGQTVFHAHLHVLGGRDLTWPPG